MTIHSNFTLVFSIRSNKDLRASSTFFVKFTVRAFGFEKPIGRVLSWDLTEAVECTLGAHMSRVYSRRMNMHDFDQPSITRAHQHHHQRIDESSSSRFLDFNSQFYKVLLRGGRISEGDESGIESNDDDARLIRFLRKLARFVENTENEPHVSKFVEMYDPQIRSFHKPGGKKLSTYMFNQRENLTSNMLIFNFQRKTF